MAATPPVSIPIGDEAPASQGTSLVRFWSGGADTSRRGKRIPEVGWRQERANSKMDVSDKLGDCACQTRHFDED